MITKEMLQRLLLVLILVGFAAPRVAQSATALRIVQTSSAGTAVYIIDPETDKVVGVVHDIEVNRGSTASLDGSRLFITGQFEKELVVVDARTFQIMRRVPLDGRPDYVSISKDGRRLYVGLGAPNAIEVLDSASLQKVKNIPIQGPVHYAYVTPDGKYVMVASVSGKTLTAISTRTEEIEWTKTFDKGVRPVAFETGPDGSTTRMFVQLTGLHGFAVVDFATQKETARITLPDIPGRVRNVEGIQGAPAHGIDITPDGKTLWVTSKFYGYAYAYSMPDLKLVAQVDVGLGPEWFAFTPDSRRMYIALAGADTVAVVDLQQNRVVARIPVGYSPKANIMVRLQVD
jgi:YVTN family beta-propeller protein